MIDLCRARLRSNPRFELIPHDRLEASQSNQFGPLNEDPDFFGILLPPSGSKLPAKAVSRDAALLLLALGQAACLPHLLTRLLGPDANDRLRQLILDGVLEVEVDGGFVSGPAAIGLLGGPGQSIPTSRVAQLSWAAIDYAEAMESLDLNELASRLYLFNAAPSTPQLQQRFAGDQQLLDFLFEADTTARRIRAHWRRQPIKHSWLTWVNEQASAAAAPYKLYVSPTLGDLPAVFAAAVESFTQAHCKQFKLGRGAYGVLRPDKLVAFFVELDQLQRAAELMRASTSGAGVQGVPFSAPVDADGLMSWGMDPPRFEQTLAVGEQQSWRQWLTERIAVYTVAARQAGVSARAFVRERIALDGVDCSNWAPDLAIWSGPAETAQEVA